MASVVNLAAWKAKTELSGTKEEKEKEDYSFESTVNNPGLKAVAFVRRRL